MDPNPDYDASDEIRHQLVSPGSCAASYPRLPIPLSKPKFPLEGGSELSLPSMSWCSAPIWELSM
jgi:hypothetical protein